MSFLTTRGKVAVAETPLSEKAMAFGQHIVELEEALTAARDQISDLDIKLRRAEAERDQFRDELKLAKKDKDYFQRMWYTTKAKLKSSASIILDAMRDEDEEDKYRPSPMSVRAVEKALATTRSLNDGGVQAPLPGFLASGPKENAE